MPAALKHAVVAEVERRGTNMNDVIVGAIARHYGLPFQPSKRRSRPGSGNGALLVRMSDRLKYSLQVDSLLRRTNMTDTVLRLLARELGLGLHLPDPSRTTPFGGGQRKVAVSLVRVESA